MWNTRRTEIPRHWPHDRARAAPIPGAHQLFTYGRSFRRPVIVTNARALPATHFSLQTDTNSMFISLKFRFVAENERPRAAGISQPPDGAGHLSDELIREPIQKSGAKHENFGKKRPTALEPNAPRAISAWACVKTSSCAAKVAINFDFCLLARQTVSRCL